MNHFKKQYNIYPLGTDKGEKILNIILKIDEVFFEI